MNDSTVERPVKTRELFNHHMDSTIWNDFTFRDDDIIIATYAKSGTTWMQQIVGQLIYGGQEGVNVAALSPWLDLRVPPKDVKLAEVDAQTHRRFLKTHLPVDALVFSSRAKYLYIGRDGRDVIWSLYNHHANANAGWYEALNDTPGRVGPPIDPPSDSTVEYFNAWLERDGFPFWSYWDNARTWWQLRDLPNVMFVHFEALKQNLPGEIGRIAEFLGIAVDPSTMRTIIDHCSFDYIKAHAELAVPVGGVFWEGGASTFIYRGVNGRWRETLPEADSAAYEMKAEAELGLECAHWFKTGQIPEPSRAVA